MDPDRTIRKALREDENQESYPCVWYKEITCPIRTRWKLLPENLAPWCPVCKQVGFLDEQLRILKAMAVAAPGN